MYTGTRVRLPHLASLAGLACLCLSSLALAQSDAQDESEEESGPPRAMDEIVVTAEKPGDRSTLETPYEEQLRQRLLKELEAMEREQEELDWRRGPRIDNPSRMSFGYRPQDRTRDNTDDSLTRLPMENTRPATIFRFEF